MNPQINLVMNKTITVIVLLTLSFSAIAQNDKELKTTKEDSTKTEVVLKKIEPISNNPLIQNKVINFNKSFDLISVKSYMRSLQLKRKESEIS